MSRQLLRLYFALVMAHLTGAAFAQDAVRMQKAVQELVDAQEFMGTVLVAQDEKVLFHRAFGAANLEWKVPHTTDSKFRIGSITKQFTAASILLLEERGKLRIEDPIGKYMDDAPTAWRSITLHHLLTHTSGIPNVTSDSEFRRRKFNEATLDESIGWFRDEPLEFMPGERMAYSNSGYFLLGYVIEKVSGMTYAEFIKENIFTPLAMNSSGYDSAIELIERRAHGYTRHGPFFINAEYTNMQIPHAAGGLYSTTGDLLRWQRALIGHKLLSESSFAKMTTPFKDNYALGIAILNNHGRTVFVHSGAIEGFSTELAYYPESRTTIAVLSNVNGSAPSQLVSKLAALAHRESIVLTSDRKEIKLAAAQLQKFVGTYELAPKLRAMFTLEGDQLVSQVSGQVKTPAYAEKENLFFIKAVDAQWEFVLNDGEVTHVILHQAGRDLKGTRISDTVEERKEIPTPASHLEAYVGTYRLRPGLDAHIRIENGTLVGQATGQSAVPLFAEAPDKFFAKLVDLQVEFRRDANGKVTELLLSQGPDETLAPRRSP